MQKRGRRRMLLMIVLLVGPWPSAAYAQGVPNEPTEEFCRANPAPCVTYSYDLRRQANGHLFQLHVYSHRAAVLRDEAKEMESRAEEWRRKTCALARKYAESLPECADADKETGKK